ncbi:BH0509 family protein [Niallia sp. Krafla_26]|uniref:BH0509 family protein n=1 Tax=Niallia sp. Krafla_26 TaxID=3064703 RepID=UPI003D169D3E
MVSIQERENMIQFLVNYFGGDPIQLEQMNDHTLENTYEFAYKRIEMENEL